MLHCLVQDDVEEFVAGSGGEAGVQPVAESHQGIDSGRDAVLFGEGLEGDILRSRLSHSSTFLQVRWYKLLASIRYIDIKGKADGVPKEP